MQRIRWRNLELPTQVICETSSKNYGRFVIEPFERGFGITIGNSLRRVLLAALEGTAVCNVKLSSGGQSVLHDYSTIPHILEDIPDIILNLKGLLIELDAVTSAKLVIQVHKKGAVTASDIQAPAGVKLIDPHWHICTLTDNIDLHMELEVRKGRGYLTAEEHERGEHNEVGLIWIDSIFSPVVKVHYTIQNTRVGKITNYDKLTLHIHTDGTLHPEMALVEASKILRKHLNPFVQYFERGRDLYFETQALPEEQGEEEEEVVAQEDEKSTTPEDKIPVELREKLNLPIDQLSLSTRALHCLENEKMKTVYDLVTSSEDDLLNIRNFGQNTLDEIRKCLKERGLSLGMLKGITV
jgi:DNA-directed RNA polymerase subunit alpha